MTNELKQYYSNLRAHNRRLHEQRLDECAQKNPRFRSLAEEPGRVFSQLALGKLNTAAAASRYAAIDAERRTLLISMGLPGDWLDDIYTCPICQDRGEVGEPTRLCACALKKLQESRIAGSRINARETFANFSDALYPTDEQKKQGLGMKRFCERYVAALPHPEKPNLLILGQSGLGKSFFGNAIAHAAIEKGLNAVKATAYQCVQTVLDGIDARENAIGPFLSAELLVLDDLGTEAMVPNVTIETVFRILNERAASGLPTVLITNLDREGLFERYGERVASRMIDAALTSIVVLRGENLRTRTR